MQLPPSLLMMFALGSILIGVPICESILKQHAVTESPSWGVSAAQIFDRHTRALGRKGAIQNVKTRLIKGTLEYTAIGQHAIAPIEIHWKAPNKLFEIAEAPFGVIRMGFNGTIGWGIHPQTGFRQLSPAEIIEVRRQGALYQPALLEDLYTRMSSEGNKKIDGHSVNVIPAVTKGGKTEKFYFDAATHLPVRLDLWEGGPEGAKAGEFYLAKFYLDDYKVIDGIQVPFVIRRVRPNSSIVYKFSEVKQNVDIEDKVFESPEQKP